MNKLWYIQKVEHHSALKKVSCQVMNCHREILKSILLTETDQFEKEYILYDSICKILEKAKVRAQ